MTYTVSSGTLNPTQLNAQGSRFLHHGLNTGVKSNLGYVIVFVYCGKTPPGGILLQLRAKKAPFHVFHFFVIF